MRAKGFTLIELMIVVAIVSLLAAIALPAYADYVTRTQVSEGVNLFAGARTALAEHGANTNAWPIALRDPTTAVGADEVVATLSGRYATLSSTLSGTYPNGSATVTMSNSRAVGTIVFETADGGLTWSCDGGSIISKYRPQPCR